MGLFVLTLCLLYNLYSQRAGILTIFKSLVSSRSRLPWWLSGKRSACQCRRQVRSLGQEDLPDKEMATHSSTLAWEIP